MTCAAVRRRTVGALSGGVIVEGNRRLAEIGGLTVTTLPCRHFPQVSIPAVLAQYIRSAGAPRPWSLRRIQRREEARKIVARG